MHSCIYEGTVRHQRVGRVHHRFCYSLFLMYLDLSELDLVFGDRWLWSAERRALARFRRDDHLGDPAVPLADCVRELVETDAGFRPNGPIRLLTHLRYFGHVFNPVSFYFCFDACDSQVEAVVAEVQNTPWGERHCYVIDARHATAKAFGRRSIRAEHAKEFHVSPFLPLDMRYRWQITEPGQQLAVDIQVLRDDRRAFNATLTLQRKPISTWQLARVLVRYPFMTGQIVAGIYWQALRLWWKGATFHSHPTYRAMVAQAEDSAADRRERHALRS